MSLSNWISSLASSHLHKEAAARQDMSLAKLQELAAQGYTSVTWQAHSTVSDFICNELNGKQWTLVDFLNSTHHDAPIFSHSHVNCHCLLELSGPNLPPVVVDSY